jgi:hypothetical protein
MQASISVIRLRISYGFWIVAFLPGVTEGLRGIAIWGAIVLGSVLLHELGHALSGLSGGRRAVIVLHQLGGHTEFEPGLSIRHATWSTLAGPLLSLLVGIVLYVTRRALTAAPSWLTIALWVNVGWGVVNLLPLVPFAGGRLLMDRLGKKHPTIALLTSAATAAAATTLGVLTIRHTGFAVLFVSLGALSLFELGKAHDRLRAQHVDTQLGVAHALVLEHRHEEAMRVCQGVFIQALDYKTRNAALTMLAWACLGQDQPRAAMAALDKIRPPEGRDPYTLAAVQRALGRIDDALQTLERAPSWSREAARLLVDLHAERGDLQRAFSTTLEHLRVLGLEDAKLVLRAFERAHDVEHAIILSQAISAMGDPIAYGKGDARPFHRQ